MDFAGKSIRIDFFLQITPINFLFCFHILYSDSTISLSIWTETA